jgi:hypothetical protein
MMHPQYSLAIAPPIVPLPGALLSTHMQGRVEAFGPLVMCCTCPVAHSWAIGMVRGCGKQALEASFSLPKPLDSRRSHIYSV